jgi:hypothetical protein
MEPVTLAAVAVGLLIGFFKKAGETVADQAGEAVGQATAGAVGRLYQRLRARFADDEYDSAVLRGIEERPDSEARRRSLEGTLAERLQEDPEFAAELQRLVDEAENSGAVSVKATDSGITAGGDVAVHAGGDVAGRDMIRQAPAPGD